MESYDHSTSFLNIGSLVPPPERLRKVLVVGAGVAGLQTCRQLLKLGAQVLVLEANDDCGGVWIRNYHGFGLQVPWRMYQFPEFPWPRDLQPSSEYPTGQEVQEYVRAYAAAYDLRRHIRFHCKLLRLRWCPGSRTWDALYCDMQQEKFFKVSVDYAVICAGIYSQPYIPDYEGTDSYAGIQLHAKDFVDLSLAHGRRVVIVGAGKTALDCVSSIVATNTATSVTLLYRQAHWPLPRRMVGTSVRNLLFNRAMTSMLPPYYTAGRGALAAGRAMEPLRRLFWRSMESVISRQFRITEQMRPRVALPADLFYGGQILDNTMDKLVRSEALSTIKGEINRFVRNGVILQDGSFVAADLVLYCTGYLKTYEYLEGDMRARLDLQKDGLYLYRNCLPYAVPHLAFIGSEVSTYNNILTHGLQALWLAHVLAGRVPLPPAPAMSDDIRAQQRWRRAVMPAQRSRGSVLMLYMMQYHDQLLTDMGAKPHRKGPNLCGECFGAYTAEDYRSVLDMDVTLAAARRAAAALAAAGVPSAVLAAAAAAADDDRDTPGASSLAGGGAEGRGYSVSRGGGGPPSINARSAAYLLHDSGEAHSAVSSGYAAAAAIAAAAVAGGALGSGANGCGYIAAHGGSLRGAAGPIAAAAVAGLSGRRSSSRSMRSSGPLTSPHRYHHDHEPQGAAGGPGPGPARCRAASASAQCRSSTGPGYRGTSDLDPDFPHVAQPALTHMQPQQRPSWVAHEHLRRSDRTLMRDRDRRSIEMAGMGVGTGLGGVTHGSHPLPMAHGSAVRGSSCGRPSRGTGGAGWGVGIGIGGTTSGDTDCSGACASGSNAGSTGAASGAGGVGTGGRSLWDAHSLAPAHPSRASLPPSAHAVPSPRGSNPGTEEYRALWHASPAVTAAAAATPLLDLTSPPAPDAAVDSPCANGTERASDDSLPANPSIVTCIAPAAPDGRQACAESVLPQRACGPASASGGGFSRELDQSLSLFPLPVRLRMNARHSCGGGDEGTPPRRWSSGAHILAAAASSGLDGDADGGAEGRGAEAPTEAEDEDQHGGRGHGRGRQGSGASAGRYAGSAADSESPTDPSGGPSSRQPLPPAMAPASAAAPAMPEAEGADPGNSGSMRDDGGGGAAGASARDGGACSSTPPCLTATCSSEPCPRCSSGSRSHSPPSSDSDGPVSFDSSGACKAPGPACPGSPPGSRPATKAIGLRMSPPRQPGYSPLRPSTVVSALLDGTGDGVLRQEAPLLQGRGHAGGMAGRGVGASGAEAGPLQSASRRSADGDDRHSGGSGRASGSGEAPGEERRSRGSSRSASARQAIANARGRRLSDGAVREASSPGEGGSGGGAAWAAARPPASPLPALQLSLQAIRAPQPTHTDLRHYQYRQHSPLSHGRASRHGPASVGGSEDPANGLFGPAVYRRLLTPVTSTDGGAGGGGGGGSMSPLTRPGSSGRMSPLPRGGGGGRIANARDWRRVASIPASAEAFMDSGNSGSWRTLLPGPAAASIAGGAVGVPSITGMFSNSSSARFGSSISLAAGLGAGSTGSGQAVGQASESSGAPGSATAAAAQPALSPLSRSLTFAGDGEEDRGVSGGGGRQRRGLGPWARHGSAAALAGRGGDGGGGGGGRQGEDESPRADAACLPLGPEPPDPGPEDAVLMDDALLGPGLPLCGAPLAAAHRQRQRRGGGGSRGGEFGSTSGEVEEPRGPVNGVRLLMAPASVDVLADSSPFTSRDYT